HPVDDIALVLAAGRRVLHVLAERPDLLDAAIRGAVDLDHIDERPGEPLDAHRALTAGLGSGARGAQECARQQPGGRRLADAARAGEQVGMRDPAGGQRVAKRTRDRVLPDDRVEGLRPPLPSENLIAQMTVHPPSNGPYCDLSPEPAPARYSHGTREGRLTVAPFRAWRGSTIPVAWGPTFNATP